LKDETKMTDKICIIIPAYNSAKTIPQVVAGALKHVPKVIVANDGSEDDTAQAASLAGAEVISIDHNQGKGHALELLFQKAIENGYDAVISMDADTQHDPDDIPKFIKAHEKYPEDLIVGSRMHEKHKIPRGRYNSMHIARFFISLAANQFIEDTQCGFRLYPLSLVKKLHLTSDRYVTETEILIKVGDIGATIRKINVNTIYGVNISHFRPVLDIDAITGYVISYLWVKWLIEGFSSNRPNTYTPHNIRDWIGGRKFINNRFMVFTWLTIFPVVLFYLIEYIFLLPFIKNNFASIRKMNHGFFPVFFATQMLLILLPLGILDLFFKTIGVKVNFLDPFIKKFYPDLWGQED
jgi:glycosyltransferase involved in cell wall biosynthesis